MGSEMRDTDSKSTVNASRTPLRSGESAASGRSGLTASRREARRRACLPAPDGSPGDRPAVHGELVEDGSQGSLQSVDSGAAQTLPPTVVDDGWEVGQTACAPRAAFLARTVASSCGGFRRGRPFGAVIGRTPNAVGRPGEADRCGPAPGDPPR